MNCIQEKYIALEVMPLEIGVKKTSLAYVKSTASFSSPLNGGRELGWRIYCKGKIHYTLHSTKNAHTVPF